MLISTWLSHCPLAVKHFLNFPTGVAYLTAQVIELTLMAQTKCGVESKGKLYKDTFAFFYFLGWFNRKR